MVTHEQRHWRTQTEDLAYRTQRAEREALAKRLRGLEVTICHEAADEIDRMREALLSYAAVQPLESKHPGQIQRDLRAIAGEEHVHVAMISDSRCLICRHDLRHEVHTRLPQKSDSEQAPETES